jgi:hypothetical protein
LLQGTDLGFSLRTRLWASAFPNCNENDQIPEGHEGLKRSSEKGHLPKFHRAVPTPV